MSARSQCDEISARARLLLLSWSLLLLLMLLLSATELLAERLDASLARLRLADHAALLLSTYLTYLGDLLRHLPRRHLPRRLTSATLTSATLTSATLTSAVSSPRLPINCRSQLLSSLRGCHRFVARGRHRRRRRRHHIYVIVVMMYHPPADSAPRSSQFRPTPRSDAARIAQAEASRIYAINPTLINN